MAAITISDLAAKRELDPRSMSLIRGADGAAWVFGWAVPFQPRQSLPGIGSIVNIYQTNIFANQLVNQVENINVTNGAPNSNLTVTAGENGKNNGVLG